MQRYTRWLLRDRFTKATDNGERVCMRWRSMLVAQPPRVRKHRICPILILMMIWSDIW